MRLIFASVVGAFLAGLQLAILAQGAPAGVGARTFDHVYVIVLENRSFDDALYGPSPYLRMLSRTQGLATYYFGVSHPSLPNYIAMIAGDDFGIRENRPSCFASNLAPLEACHAFKGETLVDQLEAKGLTWALYAEDLPAPGSLVSESPAGEQNALYVQKHNPFAFFETIAKNPLRLRNMKPLDTLERDLATGPPSFSLIVPNQCNDGHGVSTCTDPSDLVGRYDRFVRKIIDEIRASPHWTDRSAIVVTFDEGVPPNGVSGVPHFIDRRRIDDGENGGHHVLTIVVSKCGAPIRSAKALNHYSLLATIEDGFGVSRLRKAAAAETMSELFVQACQ
jgi:phospholipase C